MSIVIKGYKIYPMLVTGIKYNGFTIFGNHIVKVTEEHRHRPITNKYKFKSENIAFEFIRDINSNGAFNNKPNNDIAD